MRPSEQAGCVRPPAERYGKALAGPGAFFARHDSWSGQLLKRQDSMGRALLAPLLLMAWGALAPLAAEVAHAQTVTINGCTNASWSPSTLTLVCGAVSNPPVCSFSPAAPTTYTVGNQLTLNASCTNSPTYAWSATVGVLGTGNCNSAATCTDTQGSATNVTYHLVASNGSGTATLDAPVQWIVGTGPPTGCTISPSAQSMGSSGGAINTMTVSCSGGAPLNS